MTGRYVITVANGRLGSDAVRLLEKLIRAGELSEGTRVVDGVVVHVRELPGPVEQEPPNLIGEMDPRISPDAAEAERRGHPLARVVDAVLWVALAPGRLAAAVREWLR